MEEAVPIGTGAMPVIITAAQPPDDDTSDDPRICAAFAGIFGTIAASAIPPPTHLPAAAGGGSVPTEGYATVEPFTGGCAGIPVLVKTPISSDIGASIGVSVTARALPRAGSSLSIGVSPSGSPAATAVPSELPASSPPARAAALPLEPVACDASDLPDAVPVRSAPTLPSPVQLPNAISEPLRVVREGTRIPTESGPAETAQAPTGTEARQRSDLATPGAIMSPEAVEEPGTAAAARAIGLELHVSRPGSEPHPMRAHDSADGFTQACRSQMEGEGSGGARTQGGQDKPRLEERGLEPVTSVPAFESEAEAAAGGRETRRDADRWTKGRGAVAMEIPPDAQPAGAPPLVLGSAYRSSPQLSESALPPQAKAAPSVVAHSPEQAAPTPRRMRLEIEVPALGAIRVDLRSRGAEVAAVAMTEEVATGRALAAQTVPLRAALAAQSVHLAGFDVLAHWPGGHRGQQIAEPERGPPLPRVRSPAVVAQAGIVVEAGRIDCLI